VGTGVTDLNPSGVLPGVTMTMPTLKLNQRTAASNQLPKIDPFSVATSASNKAGETTTSVKGNPLGIMKMPIASTNPLADALNPPAGTRTRAA
jgi:hypothetical protein